MSAPTCPFCGHVSYDAEPVHVGNSASAAEVIDAAIAALFGRRWPDTCAPDARQTMRWRVGKMVAAVVPFLAYYRKSGGDAPAESLTLSLAAELGKALSERNAALNLMFPFLDKAAGEGLAFVEEESGSPAMDAADICVAVAEALGMDIGSDDFVSLCCALAALSGGADAQA